MRRESGGKMTVARLIIAIVSTLAVEVAFFTIWRWVLPEWDIIIPKMSMKYETFMDIDSSITHMETYGITYDYIEGIATMSVTNKGLKELEEMTDVIRIV